MRTNFKRLQEVTEEMELNDRLYYEMQDELEDELEYISEIEPELLPEVFDALYFYRRVISVLTDHDLPFKSAVGFFFIRKRLKVLDSLKTEFIDDSDSDSEIFKYLVEFGLQLYEDLADPDETPSEVYKNVRIYHDFINGR